DADIFCLPPLYPPDERRKYVVAEKVRVPWYVGFGLKTLIPSASCENELSLAVLSEARLMSHYSFPQAFCQRRTPTSVGKLWVTRAGMATDNQLPNFPDRLRNQQAVPFADHPFPGQNRATGTFSPYEGRCLTQDKPAGSVPI